MTTAKTPGVLIERYPFLPPDDTTVETNRGAREPNDILTATEIIYTIRALSLDREKGTDATASLRKRTRWLRRALNPELTTVNGPFVSYGQRYQSQTSMIIENPGLADRITRTRAALGKYPIPVESGRKDTQRDMRKNQLIGLVSGLSTAVAIDISVLSLGLANINLFTIGALVTPPIGGFVGTKVYQQVNLHKARRSPRIVRKLELLDPTSSAIRESSASQVVLDEAHGLSYAKPSYNIDEAWHQFRNLLKQHNLKNEDEYAIFHETLALLSQLSDDFVSLQAMRRNIPTDDVAPKNQKIPEQNIISHIEQCDAKLKKIKNDKRDRVVIDREIKLFQTITGPRNRASGLAAFAVEQLQVQGANSTTDLTKLKNTANRLHEVIDGYLSDLLNNASDIGTDELIRNAYKYIKKNCPMIVLPGFDEFKQICVSQPETFGVKQHEISANLDNRR